MEDQGDKKFRVLFVCTGNICRSPTAEAILSLRLKGAGLAGECEVDSAGIESWHAGSPPDERSVETAYYRGYDMSSLKARGIKKQDFEDFDLIIGLDKKHVETLKRRAPSSQRKKIRLLGEFGDGREVADPYHRERAAFDETFDLIERYCNGLIIHLKKHLSELSDDDAS